MRKAADMWEEHSEGRNVSRECSMTILAQHISSQPFSSWFPAEQNATHATLARQDKKQDFHLSATYWKKVEVATATGEFILNQLLDSGHSSGAETRRAASC